MKIFFVAALHGCSRCTPLIPERHQLVSSLAPQRLSIDNRSCFVMCCTRNRRQSKSAFRCSALIDVRHITQKSKLVSYLQRSRSIMPHHAIRQRALCEWSKNTAISRLKSSDTDLGRFKVIQGHRYGVHRKNMDGFLSDFHSTFGILGIKAHLFKFKTMQQS